MGCTYRRSAELRSEKEDGVSHGTTLLYHDYARQEMSERPDDVQVELFSENESKVSLIVLC